VKSLTAFSQQLLEDFGQQCGVCTTRDQEEIRRRVEHEGVSFLTITLPSYGKDFLSSLEAGRVEPNSFRAFKHGSAGLPRFLGGFLALVFDENGVVRDEPSIDAVRAVHGFTASFGKIKALCSQERIDLAMEQFVAIDEEVGSISASLPDESVRSFAKMFRRLFGPVLDTVEKTVHQGGILPNHGPGNTAEKLSANSKFRSETWTQRLEFLFPAGEYLYPNWGWYHQLQDVRFFEPHEEPPVRVVAVPKTQSTPRIIAIEPVHMQYVQQGILEALTSALQRSPLWELMGNLDQTPNQRLAQEGSRTRELATLDLSEASDRVSVRLVREALAHHPLLQEAVFACRSYRADVLGQGVITLNKFASMGSALCFPIESMVFTTIVLMEVMGNPTNTARELRKLVGRVRVYGDDIIVPSTNAVGVIDRLESYGLKVNRRKTFWKSNFRESCGMDAFSGIPVTPVRLKSWFPTDPSSVSEIAAVIAYRNQLFARYGFDRSVAFLDRVIRSAMPSIRFIPAGHPGIGLWTDDLNLIQTRFDKSLHKPMVKAHKLESVLPSDPLEDHGALMKFFLKRGDKPRDEKHLQRYGRPLTVRIKSAWLAL
jgi:hypothetical protein